MTFTPETQALISTLPTATQADLKREGALLLYAPFDQIVRGDGKRVTYVAGHCSPGVGAEWVPRNESDGYRLLTPSQALAIAAELPYVDEKWKRETTDAVELERYNARRWKSPTEQEHAALKAENERLRAALNRLSEYANTYGKDLCPTGPDSYGEGVRAAKNTVRNIIASMAEKDQL